MVESRNYNSTYLVEDFGEIDNLGCISNPNLVSFLKFNCCKIRWVLIRSAGLFLQTSIAINFHFLKCSPWRVIINSLSQNEMVCIPRDKILSGPETVGSKKERKTDREGRRERERGNKTPETEQNKRGKEGKFISKVKVTAGNIFCKCY